MSRFSSTVISANSPSPCGMCTSPSPEMYSGVRPATGWLEGSGVWLENGVAVDAGLRASWPGVYAVGDCAADCGVFAGSPAVVGPLSGILPVDLHIRGCPPPPVDIVRGLLALIEALK